MDFILDMDMSILNWIYDNLRCGFLNVFMPFITMFGESGIFFIALSLVMIIIPKTRKTGIMMGVALFLGLIICNLTLKPLVARPRPYTIRTDVILLVDKLSDFSFPSGHTIAAFEVASVLMIRNRKYGIAATVLAVLIAFSRLYLYVHYPTDVLVSIVLGTIFGFISVKLVNKIYDKLEKKKGVSQ